MQPNNRCISVLLFFRSRNNKNTGHMLYVRAVDFMVYADGEYEPRVFKLAVYL